VARRHLDRLSSDYRRRLANARVAWDLVAVFPPSITWESEMPWPSVWGRPVIQALEQVRAQLPASPGH